MTDRTVNIRAKYPSLVCWLSADLLEQNEY